MNLTPALTLALSVLTLVALATSAVILVVLVLATRWPAAREASIRLQVALSSDGLRLAWLVAAIATAGSLYFSEVAGYEPCRLCWYQRIAMYPLSVILGIAAIRGDTGIVRYALPLTVIGAPISLYHYLIEWLPAIAGDACDPRNPCTLVWFRELGVVTLPLMALAAFVLIALVLVLADRGRSIPLDEEAPA